MNKRQASRLTSAGIGGLLQAMERAEKEAIRDGEIIFWLTTSGEATQANLNGLVRQDSLAQLILFTLDHRTKITAAFQNERSANLRAKRRFSNEKLVLAWCDAIPQRARLPYKFVVPVAASKLGISAHTSVREGIALWRKSNK